MNTQEERLDQILLELQKLTTQVKVLKNEITKEDLKSETSQIFYKYMTRTNRQKPFKVKVELKNAGLDRVQMIMTGLKENCEIYATIDSLIIRAQDERNAVIEFNGSAGRKGHNSDNMTVSVKSSPFELRIFVYDEDLKTTRETRYFTGFSIMNSVNPWYVDTFFKK